MPQPYNLVKDDQDIRVPLHSDEEFFHGISFNAKVSLTVSNCRFSEYNILNTWFAQGCNSHFT